MTYMSLEKYHNLQRSGNGREKRGRGRGSKYHNEAMYYNEARYDSVAEATRAASLDYLVAAGDILGWTRQVRFPLGSFEHVYVVDFLVWHIDGTTHVEDVKGFETASFRTKKRLWKRYGPCPLHVISGKNLEIIEPRP